CSPGSPRKRCFRSLVLENQRPARTCYLELTSLRFVCVQPDCQRSALTSQGSFQKPNSLAPASKAVTDASNTYNFFATALTNLPEPGRYCNPCDVFSYRQPATVERLPYSYRVAEALVLRNVFGT